MLSAYRSLDEARRAFDAYARIDSRLRPLWELCRRAAPPAHQPAYVDDAYDVDPFDADALATQGPEEGWCAEHYFLEHVKSKLLLLAGAYRPGDPEELRSPEAYEALYDLLINWALHRPCACCAGDAGSDAAEATTSP